MLRDMWSDMTPMVNQEPLKPAPLVRDAIPSGSIGLVRSGSYIGPVAGEKDGEKDDTSETSKFGRDNEETNSENVAVENNDSRQDLKLNPLEKRAMAWDEAESTKYMARFKQEEMKIQAWENHEKRKAEMEIKRMEAKAERLKTRAQEKYTNKLASTRRVAEEKRAQAEVSLNEKSVKTSERADYIRRTGHLPSFFAIKMNSCW